MTGLRRGCGNTERHVFTGDDTRKTTPSVVLPANADTGELPQYLKFDGATERFILTVRKIVLVLLLREPQCPCRSFASRDALPEGPMDGAAEVGIRRNRGRIVRTRTSYKRAAALGNELHG